MLLIFVAGLAELDAERHSPKANITGFSDAMWWAMTTVTTVGYGDRYPVTTTGRLVAAGLMIGGIALIGAVTAGVAAWLIERVRAVEEGAQAVTRRDIAELAARLDVLIAARDRPPMGRRASPRADEYADAVAPSPSTDTPDAGTP